jgi:hypothetical protein
MSIFLGPAAVGVYLYYPVLFYIWGMTPYDNLSDFLRGLSPKSWRNWRRLPRMEGRAFLILE